MTSIKNNCMSVKKIPLFIKIVLIFYCRIHYICRSNYFDRNKIMEHSFNFKINTYDVNSTN